MVNMSRSLGRANFPAKGRVDPGGAFSQEQAANCAGEILAAFCPATNAFIQYVPVAGHIHQRSEQQPGQDDTLRALDDAVDRDDDRMIMLFPKE